MVYAIIAVLILILDQGMKYLTVLKIPLGGENIPLINGIIHLTHINNSGAAFGMLSAEQFRWPLVALTAVFAVVVIILIATKAIKGKFGRLTALFVLAGALGNGVDRLLHGYVVDMFEVEFIKFAVFNVADIFITVGGILFCFYLIFHREQPEQPAAGDRQPKAKKEKKEKRSRASEPETVEPVKAPAEPKPAVTFEDWTTAKLPKLDGKGGMTTPADAAEVTEDSSVDLKTVPTWKPPVEKAAPADAGDEEFSLEDILREFGSKN